MFNIGSKIYINSSTINKSIFNEAVVEKIITILKRKIIEKSGDQIVFSDSEPGDISIQLSIENGIGTEGYTISDISNGVRITGNDERGLLYGVGKLLRTAQYEPEVFILGTWRGSSLPDKPIRGIYFASHFNNFYHCAPIDEICKYVEELALWGVNVIEVWYDMHHFAGIHTPEAIAMVNRLREIFKAAKCIGLMTMLGTLGNEGYNNSPIEMRAEWSQQNGYYRSLGSHYHVELCPNKPGAMEQLLQWKKEEFEALADIGVDFVAFGPYDQGGCTCEKCSPWGGNGFLKVTREASKLARECLPNVKIVLFAWLFDYFVGEEWESLAKALETESPWFDYIEWDYNTTCNTGTDFILSPYIAENGVPGNIPMLGFPEISMFATQPYGGWGANPQLAYMQKLWDDAGHLFCGGFPYSEGIYEDINKIICAQLYWNSSRKVDDIAKEYISYEYSSTYADEILKAVKMMQQTYVRRPLSNDSVEDFMVMRQDRDINTRYVIQNTQGIEEIYAILSHVDNKLPESVRKAWRWRVLYIRSILDHELLNNNFQINDRADEVLEELVEIYHAQIAEPSVAPTSRKVILAFWKRYH